MFHVSMCDLWAEENLSRGLLGALTVNKEKAGARPAQCLQGSKGILGVTNTDTGSLMGRGAQGRGGRGLGSGDLKAQAWKAWLLSGEEG